MRLTAALLIAATFPTAARGFRADEQNAVANDNRTPAGTHSGDTLVLHLTVAPVTWRILGDENPGFKVLAFGEDGKTPTIPAPLVRVRIGTPIHVVIRNPLADTLVLRGFSERRPLEDSLVVLPGTTRDVSFVPHVAGTYQYWAYTAAEQRTVVPAVKEVGLVRPRYDSQLAGALIIDPPGRVPNDRIFVITEISSLPPFNAVPRDRHGIPLREFTALNGRSWPYTERLHYSVGDTVRWRIINTTFQSHPMHLHGFFYRVDSKGSAVARSDSVYTPAQRRMAVTDVIGIGENESIVWSPDRPGNWVFHCHLTNHAAKLPPVDQPDAVEYPITHDHGDPDHHFVNGMNGLILGISVDGKSPALTAWHPTKRLRLFVQSDSLPGESRRRFGYVLQRGAEPRLDSIESPGPVLLLTRGEQTNIEVVNRTDEPTAVHWHGIELDSYYDGAVGWSGNSTRTEPAIRPNSSFDVHITPKRAGTFMYHTHFNEMRQQINGLVGPLIVLEPGQTWDSAHDLIFTVSDADSGRVVINGLSSAPVKDLQVGTTYRLRVADIAAFRQNLFVRMVRDSSQLKWRPVAKDGFTLSLNQSVIRPSIARVSSGETADFEFTPEKPGDLKLEIASLGRGVFQTQGTVRFRAHE